MALTNLGFEDDDAGTPDVGIPEAWTILYTTAVEQTAVFGSSTPPLDEEDFEEGWDNTDYLFAFDTGDTLPTLLDVDVSEGEAVEDFEEGWSSNQAYLFELDGPTAASFDVSPEDVEDFEEGWSTNESYLFALGASTLASFDSALTPQTFEDFEDGWPLGAGADNDYLFALGPDETAFFGAFVPESYEGFEYAYTELQVTVDPSTNLFTSGTAHGLVANDKVTFRPSGAVPSVLPAGIAAAYQYVVIASGLTATAFRVSLVAAGTQVDVLDTGSGTFYVAADPAFHWIIPSP